MKKCPYCCNGRIIIEGSYSYECTDCDGNGYIKEEGIDYWVCACCGKEVDYELREGEVCEDCEEYIEKELEKE